MMENKKKKIFCGAAVLILFASISLPMTTAQYADFLKQEETFYPPESLETIDEKESYIGGIGPSGVSSSDDCYILTDITKQEAESLYDNVFNCTSYNSTNEYIQSNIDLLKDIEIMPDEIYSNITDLLSQQTIPLTQAQPFTPKIRFGPTLFFYGSVMSQYTFIDDPTNQIVPFFNITRLYNILEIFFNMDNPIFNFAENISCSYYSKLTTWQIGIGGSVSIFASVGPIPNQNYYFYGPFLGVFIFPVTLFGIYIFKEIDDPRYPGGSFEQPYLDIIIGIPLVFSLVLPGWYVEPDNFD